MRNDTQIILYFQKDIKILKKTIPNPNKIIALNPLVYYKAKKVFPKSKIKKYDLSEDIKKKIISYEINTIKNIEDRIKNSNLKQSSVYNFIFLYKRIMRLFLIYNSIFGKYSHIGIIKNNKIIFFDDNLLALKSFIDILYEKEITNFGFNKPIIKKFFFFHNLFNSLTLKLIKNKKILWYSFYGKNFSIFNKNITLDSNKFAAVSFHISNNNNILKSISIFLINLGKIIIYRNKCVNLKLFPVIKIRNKNTNSYNVLFNKLFNDNIFFSNNHNIYKYFNEIIINSESLYSNFDKIINKYNFTHYISHQNRPIISSVISYLFKKKNKHSFLFTHGTHSIQFDKISIYESRQLADGMIYSDFASLSFCQSLIAKNFMTKEYPNAMTYNINPVMWISLQNYKPKPISKHFNILFATTFKVLNSGFWIYDNSFNFLNIVKRLSQAISNLENVNLTIRVRYNFELDKKTLLNYLSNFKNIHLSNNSLNVDLNNSDLIVTGSSTIIEEALNFRKPVAITSNTSYQHIQDSNNFDIRKSTYNLDMNNLEMNLKKIRNHHKNKNLSDSDLKSNIWITKNLINFKLLNNNSNFYK
jgi:hypothetical protein